LICLAEVLDGIRKINAEVKTRLSQWRHGLHLSVVLEQLVTMESG
jgi:hypothetical protein